jgi:hypothetical protein
MSEGVPRQAERERDERIDRIAVAFNERVEVLTEALREAQAVLDQAFEDEAFEIRTVAEALLTIRSVLPVPVEGEAEATERKTDD